jgi:glycosyltransferase involved in cell wall biosynthesis
LSARGGAERKILLLKNYFLYKNLQVRIIVFKYNKNKTFHELINNKDDIVVLSKFSYKPFIWLNLLFYLLFNKFDYLIASNYPANLFIPFLAFKKIKTLWICNEVAVLLDRKKSLFWKIFYVLEKHTVYFFDSIIVNSKNTKKIFSKYYGVKPKVIFPGIDAEKLLGLSPVCPKKFYFKGVKFIFILSRLEKHKNLIFIEKITNYISNLSVKFKIVVAGDGPETCYIQKLEKKFPFLLYLGRVSEEEKKWLYLNSHLFLFLPKDEPLGVTVLEAMFFKCKVIAFKSGGPVETIQKSFFHKLCKNDEDYLIEVKKNLLLEINKDEANLDRDRVKDQFSIKRMNNDFYMELTNK